VGFSSTFDFEFEQTLVMQEKKKCTPSIALMASSNSNLLEAILNLASSISSLHTCQGARHAIAFCSSLI
jgi:hypothetical protein